MPPEILRKVAPAEMDFVLGQERAGAGLNEEELRAVDRWRMFVARCKVAIHTYIKYIKYIHTYIEYIKCIKYIKYIHEYLSTHT